MNIWKAVDEVAQSPRTGGSWNRNGFEFIENIGEKLIVHLNFANHGRA